MAVVPVYNVLAAPESNVPLVTEYYQHMVGRVPVSGERVTMIFLKEEQERESFTNESFFPIGLTGTITEVSDKGYIVIQTGGRIELREVTVYQDRRIDLDIERRADIDDLDADEAERRVKEVKKAIIRFSENSQWGTMVRSMVSHWASMGDIAGVMSRWMVNSARERYAVLAEDSKAKRDALIESMIYENLELGRVNGEAQSAQEENYQKLYRESAIKRQIEYLQKELDALHPDKISDIRRFELKIQDSGMNDEARAEAEKVLNRLKQEGQQSAESGMLYDYLDYVTGLSWKKEKAECIDLSEAEQILEEDHFGLRKVKKRILQQIAVMSLRGQQSGSILLFVGAPGTGKTSIGQSIAGALKRKYVRVSLGGVRDEADIRGHRRTYIGAMAGRIIDGIRRSGVSNPVMVLDEVDKLSSSYNGDPASALLEVLDPEQNHSFTDHYLNAPYDLSDVLFVCTANTLDTIPAPLLNRMEIIEFQGYTRTEKFQIARRHLLPKAMKSVGIGEQQFSVTDGALYCIIDDYTRESGVRGLKKCADRLLRSAAVELVQRRAERTEINEENLRSYMDTHPMKHGRVRENYTPGVVTGLAWTSVGGEILCIETLFTRGSGKLLITGQLGDVMRESAQIAVSKVKGLFPEKAKLFEENDLHIHVPDGATPKDGPSAGITLTTALASLVTGCVIPSDIAMTGEVSLQSGVKPIGGLPEKLMAAQRAGVRTVYIPADNADDLDEVAEEVKAALEIVPVKEVPQLFAALDIPMEESAKSE